ncbi:MAG: radical SAM protein [Ectothiorhodospiraceae bacterium]|nr:radical SAM protein [Ectothiorhodospiraceae bacterium]
MPILCNYYITYRCNAYCDFCHFGDHSQFKNTTHAKREEVLANLPALRELGVKFIDFTGGEPLLHQHAAEFAAEAKKLGMTTSITTNGLLYPKYAEALRGNVDLLHFSLDSASKEQHDTVRGVPCYDAVMDSIALAKSLGQFPDIIFTVTNENYRELPEVQRICAENDLLLILNPIFSYFKEEGLNDEALDYTEDFAKKPYVYLNPSFIALRRMGGNNPDSPLCKAASRVIVISPQNEILLPCYHLHNEKLPIGSDLREAIRSPRVAWHRQMEGRHEFCKGCTINCYFEPSFAFPVNALSLATVPSKIKYGYYKYVKQAIAK